MSWEGKTNQRRTDVRARTHARSQMCVLPHQRLSQPCSGASAFITVCLKQSEQPQREDETCTASRSPGHLGWLHGLNVTSDPSFTDGSPTQKKWAPWGNLPLHRHRRGDFRPRMLPAKGMKGGGGGVQGGLSPSGSQCVKGHLTHADPFAVLHNALKTSLLSPHSLSSLPLPLPRLSPSAFHFETTTTKKKKKKTGRSQEKHIPESNHFGEAAVRL